VPYSPSYVMRQLARGRPLPTGSPQPALHRAVSQLSPLSIDEALRQGAHPDSPDAQGRTALHALFDHAGLGHPALRPPMDRLIACSRSLLRAGASVHALHPIIRETVLGRTAVLAAHPQALVWWHFWRSMHPGAERAWHTPQGIDRLSPLEAWRAHASPEVALFLPSETAAHRARRSP
jgi:hypothetical protein